MSTRIGLLDPRLLDQIHRLYGMPGVLRAIRVERNVSGIAVAKLTGLTPANFYSIERGCRRPSPRCSIFT